MFAVYFSALMVLVQELDDVLGGGTTVRFIGAFNDSILPFAAEAPSEEAKTALLKLHALAIEGMGKSIEFEALNGKLMAYLRGEG